MKNILRWILSVTLFFIAVPSNSAMDLSDKAGMEEVKKKKWGKKKKSSSKKGGKGTKKGFWQKLFGDS